MSLSRSLSTNNNPQLSSRGRFISRITKFRTTRQNDFTIAMNGVAMNIVTNAGNRQPVPKRTATV
jgi:hypothetical protein